MPVPKVKAAKVEGSVNNIAEVDVCHNDEEMFPDDWNADDDVQMPDSEDEYIAGQAEGEGPPSVSQEKLKELDERAALDELDKLHQMQVIEPTIFLQNKLQLRTQLIQLWSLIGGTVETSG